MTGAFGRSGPDLGGMERGAPTIVVTPSRAGGRVVLVVLFVVYLLLLAWLVLWKLEIPYVGAGAMREIKLVPFGPSAGAGASAPFEVVANLLLFVPFGLYLGLLAPRWPLWKAVGTVGGASLVLEVAQYVLAVGISDVTDLVVNTAGGVAGVGVLAVARRRLRARTATVVTRVCSIATVLSLLAIGIFVVAPVRYGPPRDAGDLVVSGFCEDAPPSGECRAPRAED